MKKKKVALSVIACVASLCMTAGLAACTPDEGGNKTPHTPVAIDAASTSIIVKGYEWGPAIPKIIVEFKGDVTGVNKDTFAVSMSTGFFGSSKRTVTDAYLCDANGNKVTSASKYVAIEMTPKYNEASPFTYDNATGRNSWNNSIPVTVTVNGGKSFKAGTAEYRDGDKFEYTVTAANRKVPQTASWNKDTVHYTGEGKDITLQRASWAPAGAADDDRKNPLVIWLHGGGEGGTDIDIALLGNEVTALTTENDTNVQHYFKTGGSAGAYVLAVQTPTMWMDAEGNDDYGDSEANSEPTGEPQTSYYTEALWQAITDYVDNNDDIDTDRIYIGGCSNGGYMTMNLALEHGDYFAAYYPICQGYMSGNINDDMLAKLKDLNMWFLLSEDDTTLRPEKYTIPLYYRLLQAGAENVHLTYKKNVPGVDDPNPSAGFGGTAGYYMGHWSWICAFNDDVKTEIDNSKVTSQDYLTPENCTKAGNMWQWIAEQGVKPAEPVETDTFEAENAVITNGKGQGMIGWDQNANQPIYGEFDVVPTVESGNKYTSDGSTGDPVTNVGYFCGTGATMTWTVTAAEACDVTITLHAAAAIQDQSGITNNQTGEGLKFAEVDLSQNAYVKLIVNNEDQALTGVLPGLTGLNWTSVQNPAVYKNFGTGTATVHLNAGTNTIVLAATNQSQGINIDKIVISGTTVKLSYIPTDNSSRIPQQQPQG